MKLPCRWIIVSHFDYYYEFTWRIKPKLYTAFKKIINEESKGDYKTIALIF